MMYIDMYLKSELDCLIFITFNIRYRALPAMELTQTLSATTLFYMSNIQLLMNKF